jgi:hypothetical protein
VNGELRTANANCDMIGKGSRGWGVLQTGEAGRLAYCERDGSRALSGTNGKIVPFVSGVRETRRENVCFSREDDIHSRVEAIFELTLIAAGLAGVIAGLIAI